MGHLPELALNAAEELVVGVAGGPHALPLELGGDAVEIHARIARGREHVSAAEPSSSNVRPASPWSANARSVFSGIALTTSGPMGSLTSSTSGVARILGAGAGPQRSLGAGSQTAHALPGEA